MPFYEAPKPALPHPHRSRFVQCLFVHHFLGRWGVKELIESDKDSHGMHAGFVVHSKDLFLLCRDFFLSLHLSQQQGLCLCPFA